MKKAITLSIGIFLISFSTLIASTNSQSIMYNPNFVNYGNSYIFTVQNVEFSVFPDGQFDFTYIGNYNNTNVTISSPNVNVSYNAGYNYEMYVQYDIYGGVIQVENVPIYYDEFGRITQAGDVQIYYNRNRIVRVGGLYVHYNYYGYYTHCTGYINSYNFYYAYRPWHAYYVRPVYTSCVVYDYPYRRYYNPTRFSYKVHHNYYSNRGRSNVSYANGRRNFNKPGSRVHHKNGRSEINKKYKPNRRRTDVAQSKPVNQSSHRRTSLSKKRDSNSKPVSFTRPSENSTMSKRTQKVNTSYRGGSSQNKRYLNTNNNSKRETTKPAVASNSKRNYVKKENNTTKKVVTSKRRGL